MSLGQPGAVTPALRAGHTGSVSRAEQEPEQQAPLRGVSGQAECEPTPRGGVRIRERMAACHPLPPARARGTHKAQGLPCSSGVALVSPPRPQGPLYSIGSTGLPPPLDQAPHLSRAATCQGQVRGMRVSPRDARCPGCSNSKPLIPRASAAAPRTVTRCRPPAGLLKQHPKNASVDGYMFSLNK